MPPRLRASLVLLVLFAGCRFDPAYRDYPEPRAPVCTAGALACDGGKLVRCSDDGGGFGVIVDDCAARGLLCAGDPLFTCVVCAPGATECDGQTVTQCDQAGQTRVAQSTCDNDQGLVCRAGACVDLCAQSAKVHSNIGCEYWGADLDNAMIDATLNAAAQQYAIVVSNAQPDVPARVTVTQDDSAPGSAAQLRVVGTATIASRNLEVFKLGPREVDGSADGTFNTGTGTALTRHAYKVTSNVPIVAYQFNPLENVNVFSNDASMLLPVSALGTQSAYVIAGWPQTIATSTDPATNFGLDLRAFLAIVGVRPDTHVHVKTTARVIPGGPFPQGIAAGAEVDVVLQPFEVLNLETGEFNGDFTGSLVQADGPVAVFPGSEASDAPFFSKLSDRFCCADHLEHQAPPIRTVGKTYALAKMPSRTKAVIAAGGDIGAIDEPEFFRVVAVSSGTTHVTTTLAPPYDAFDLGGVGESITLTTQSSVMLKASQPVTVLDVQASQDAGGVPRGLPGGDPSTMFIAPVEQWRSEYVLLTPDKYIFDFLVISAPAAAHVFLDGFTLDAFGCTQAKVAGSTYVVYGCQLSFPVIDSTVTPAKVQPGKQNDGVHHVQADLPVGVTAYGFDSYVSYAYAGGTQLEEINVR